MYLADGPPSPSLLAMYKTMCVWPVLQFRLVVKTALKLLLVFVEYTECNTILLLQAVYAVDRLRGQ